MKSRKYFTHSNGFTITELLVVIAVIVILATVTSVLFVGAVDRSNKASAQSAAARTLSKATNYSAESPDRIYPQTFSALTGASSNTSYRLTDVSFTTSRMMNNERPSDPSVLNFFVCSTGAAVEYFDYENNQWAAAYTGGATGIGGSGTSDCIYQGS